MSRRLALPLLLLCALAAAATAGCRCSGDDDEGDRPAASSSAPPAAPPDAAAASATAAGSAGPQATAAERADWAACAERRAAAQKEPALPGAPTFEQRRVQFARVRGRALLWRRAPEPASATLDERVADNKTALAAVKGLLGKHQHRESRRKIFLREGYLFHDDVEVALAVVEMIGLTTLHSEPTLYLQRGVQTYELERLERTRYLPVRYAYKNGPLAGETAEILLGDRVGTSREAVTDGALAIDLRDASSGSDFDRLRPLHLAERSLVAEVRYGADTWVPALFELAGPQARLACEVLTDELHARKQQFVAEQRLRRRALAQLRRVIHDEVREQIPFDAAADNENGFLRRAWLRAYEKGWRRFTHRERKFDVYNTEGKPIPPQVCIDFLTDTWERAAGSWFAPMTGDPPKPHPGRSPGPIDFDALADLKNRRSVAKFVQYTKRHPELFDTWDLPLAERHPFRNREPFFTYLADNSDRFQPGDVIILYGTKHGGRPHYHSLFILMLDPVTGVPTRVAGNAVFPREQTLEGIMQISPKRSIRHRIRLRDPWLKLIAAQAPDDEDDGRD